VVAFAGDAIICVFCATSCGPESSISPYGQAPPLSAYALKAFRCAAILKEFTTTQLSTHIGISAGDMKFAMLGGLDDKWAYILNGECIFQLDACIRDAGAKQMVATKTAYELVHGIPGMTLVATECPSGSTNYLVKSVIAPNEIMQSTRESGQFDAILLNHFKGQRQFDPAFEPYSDQIQMFVPRPVLVAIFSDSLARSAELRQVCTMFLSLDSYSPELHNDPIALQPFFAIVQQSLKESGGYLRQFVIDDKGCAVIAMWGVPGFSYANNCQRGVYSAVGIQKRAASELQLTCSLGVATGFVYCGVVGSLARRDYAMMGAQVNMAARLMAKAKGRVLIDKVTRDTLAPQQQTSLEAAEVLQLKGSSVPVQPYYYAAAAAPTKDDLLQLANESTIIRRNVQQMLTAQLMRISHRVDQQYARLNRQRSVSISRNATDTSSRSSNRTLSSNRTASSHADEEIQTPVFTIVTGPGGEAESTCRAECFAIFDVVIGLRSPTASSC
jgi:Adenylate and Guanylate cyclase catalytic domain